MLASYITTCHLIKTPVPSVSMPCLRRSPLSTSQLGVNIVHSSGNRTGARHSLDTATTRPQIVSVLNTRALLAALRREAVASGKAAAPVARLAAGTVRVHLAGLGSRVHCSFCLSVANLPNRCPGISEHSEWLEGVRSSLRERRARASSLSMGVAAIKVGRPRRPARVRKRVGCMLVAELV